MGNERPSSKYLISYCIERDRAKKRRGGASKKNQKKEEDLNENDEDYEDIEEGEEELSVISHHDSDGEDCPCDDCLGDDPFSHHDSEGEDCACDDCMGDEFMDDDLEALSHHESEGEDCVCQNCNPEVAALMEEGFELDENYINGLEG